MFKNLVLTTFLLLFSLTNAQDFSASWNGYFSYYNINKVISGGEHKIFAAAENAVFSLDTQSNNIEEYTTINGLSGETISTIYYSEAYDLLIIGYKNGLIEIVFNNGDDVLSVVDILEKTTIPPTQKKINNFNEHENLLYIATNYGISVFNLERLEFGDTYFIGTNGNQIPVNSTTIHNNFIYAACADNNGIKKVDLANSNLINFQNWQTITTGSYLFIENTSTKLYTIGSNRKIFEIIADDNLIERATYRNTPLDFNFNNNLAVTTANNVFVYDENFNALAQVNIETAFSTTYTSATTNSNTIFIGTSSLGVLKTNFETPTIFEEVHPDGPLINTPFRIQADPTGVWVTFGEHDIFFNPYPLNSRGFSHLTESQWLNTKFEDVLGARCLNTITINPFINNQVFISSFFDGILELNDEIPTNLFDETNSSFEDLVLASNPNYMGDTRVGSSAFDNDGVLWIINNRTQEPLKTYNPTNNQWGSHSFADISATGGSSEIGYVDVIVDNNDTKWVGGHYTGVVGYNENLPTKIKNIIDEDRNMPSNRVYALALDKRNQLWIGTDRGLRVLYNTAGFFDDDNIQVDEIIIEEDGIAKELLFQQLITDIKVDGSNNKWIGTADSGLFYFSQDGQNTIYHFTKTNSPLPSNTINDISLDSTNGIVYIATSRGLVSFKSGGSSPFKDLTNAYAYPNPVRPGFNIVSDKVKIKDISENVNIKITDIEGNLVAEAQSNINQRHRGYNLEIDGGTAYWNGKNLANNLVASGVYLIMLSDLDTFETNVIKLMLVR